MQTQHLQKLNVYARIFDDRIVGYRWSYIFLNGYLSEKELCLELLEFTIKLMKTNISENDQNYLDDQLIFQQKGASPHYALPVRQYSNQQLLEHWIGKPGSIEWHTITRTVSPKFVLEEAFEK